MADSIIQTSFNSGEWAPSLNARVDLQKYRSGAALLRNFFVDYRGGATTRPGTKYILQTKSTNTVRLIPFQASFSVSYALEFGDSYLRFYSRGAPVLEAAIAITSATAASPGVFTKNTHGLNNGDWVFASGFTGGTWGTNFNGNYYIVAAATANTFELTDLNGNLINTTGFGVFTAGNVQRVYTIASPYAATELSQIKYAQNVNTMILCHPNHPPYQLVLTSATSWALTAISFGSTVTAPTGLSVATTLGAGTVNYAYVVTAIDSATQESGPSAFATLTNKLDIRTNAGTNTISWSTVTGAVQYNIYRAQLSYAGAVPAGSMFGFIGNTTSTSFIDSNILPDFTQTPPIPQNPFSGSGVQSVTITNPGTGFTSVPGVTFSGGGGSGAAGSAVMVNGNSPIITVAGSGYFAGEAVTINGDTSGLVLVVTSVDGSGGITGLIVGLNGQVTSGSIVTSGFLIGSLGRFAQASISWGVKSIGITNPGTGYATPPAVGFVGGGGINAAANTVLGSPSSGNPTVPGFFQQRLILAGPVSSPQQFNMSKPGAPYNFDISQIIQPDDAIQGTLVSGQLNTIQYMMPMPTGLIMISDKQAWLINGGSPGSAISATQLVANAQAYNGASGPPPVVATNDVLYVQAKGSIVRDLVFNFYVQVYTGTDISALSSHLFYGFTVNEWAWAEEPFKLLWSIRSDGTLLCLTFLKEQEFIAWTHSDTLGSFKSIASIVEPSQVGAGSYDSVYLVVQRTINGNVIQYVEHLTQISQPASVSTAWQVDAGISFNGSPTTTFSGAQHLAGATVTGIATTDTGVASIITPFAMPTTGTFTLPAPAAPATGYISVAVGLPFTAQLQTLAIDTGNPNIQGKVKQLPDVVVRVKDALGLSIGQDFNHLVPMKDLVVGNVSSMLTGQQTQIITDLVTGDARTFIGPAYTVPGQYCIQQSNPLPATILGVIPNITVGDEGTKR